MGRAQSAKLFRSISRGTWPIRKFRRSLPNLLTDSPVAAPHIVQLFEQSSVADALTETVAAFVTKSNRKHHDTSLLIALHGRLGQGKSRVINEVIGSTDWQMLHGHGWNFPVRVSKFNCSDYQPDDLLLNFDKYIESSRVFVLSVLFSVAAILIFSLFKYMPFFELGAFVNLSWRTVVISSVAVGLIPLRHLFRDVLRDVNLRKNTNEILSMVFDRLFIRPDIIIIDDLDRATVAQQKSVLQCLNRHKSGLHGTAIIVVFDDAAISGSNEPRNEANELLTKVFDVSFRLASMNALDAAAMANSYGRALFELNPSCHIAKFFAEPIVCGALARVFVLHGNASARFSKKLVNNVYSSARSCDFVHEADVVALIRLHSIFQYLPALENELDFLNSGLLNSSERTIFETIEERFGKDIEPETKRSLRRLIRSTQHMQPTNLTWQRLLRVWRDTSTRKDERVCPPVGWSNAWTENWAMNEAFITSLEDPLKRLQTYRSLVAYPGMAARVRDLRASDHKPISKLEATAKSVSKPQLDYGPTADEIMEEGVHFEYWQALADCLAIFDSDVLKLMTKTERAQLLDRHRQNPLSMLVFSNNTFFGFEGAHSAWRHSLYALDSNIEDRLRHELSVNFSEIPLENVQINKPKLPSTYKKIQPIYLESTWPNFTPLLGVDVSMNQVNEHFGELGLILFDLPRREPLFPDAHLDWCNHGIDQNRIGVVLNALRLLNQSTQNKDRLMWFVGAQRRFWQRIDSPDRVFDFICKKFIDEEGALFDLWCLSVGCEVIDEGLLPEYLRERILNKIVDVSNLDDIFPKQNKKAKVNTPNWLEDLDGLEQHWPLLQKSIQIWLEK